MADYGVKVAILKINNLLMLCICAVALFSACEKGSDGGLLQCSRDSDCAEGLVCNDNGKCIYVSDGDADRDFEIVNEEDVDIVESETLESEIDCEKETPEDSESEEYEEIESDLVESEPDEETEEFYEYSVKVINLPMADIIPVLPTFAEKGLILYLNVMASHIGDPDFAELLRQAEIQNVPVKLWPLLTPEEGAWCNEDNSELFIQNVYAILDYVQTLENNVEIIVINSELGPPKIDLIRQYFADGNLVELYKLLKSNVDREKFVDSQNRIQAMVDEIHQRGFMAQITTYPYLLDDLIDTDNDIQDAANVVLEGVEWDRLAFTPYSAAYTDDFEKPFGPYFVYSYSQMARERFGRKADIALGLIAPGGTHTYETPQELAADVAAAKAAGIHRIDVFDLAGMMKDDRFDEWAEALLAEPAIPPEEETTIDFHEDFALADSLLDGVNED